MDRWRVSEDILRFLGSGPEEHPHQPGNEGPLVLHCLIEIKDGLGHGFNDRFISGLQDPGFHSLDEGTQLLGLDFDLRRTIHRTSPNRSR